MSEKLPTLAELADIWGVPLEEAREVLKGTLHQQQLLSLLPDHHLHAQGLKRERLKITIERNKTILRNALK